jgi:hypothetical protein
VSAYKDLCIGLAHIAQDDPKRSAELVTLMTRMRAEIRAKAFEEAANAALRMPFNREWSPWETLCDVAATIRALKETP